MPNSAEIAELRVNGAKYRDWEMVSVQRAFGTEASLMTFAVSSPVEAGTWAGQKLKIGDKCQCWLAGVQVADGVLMTRQVVYDARNHGLQVQVASLTKNLTYGSVEQSAGFIAGADLTPTDTDLTQLWQAIQRLGGSGQGQLRYVSPTSIRLNPVGGDRIKVAGQLVQIPSGGISVANTNVRVNGTAAQNLAASTTYLVALGSNGVLEFWSLATGHQPDTTAGNVGVEVITGQADKTLVGMVATNASSQFTMSSAFAGVISWHNRRSIGLIGATTPSSATSSIGYVELHGPSRVYFLSWADEAVDMIVVGQANNGTTAFSVSAGVGVDGIFQGIAGGSYTASGGQNSFTAGFQRTALSEGLHYVTPMGTVGAGGTGTFSLAALATIRG